MTKKDYVLMASCFAGEFIPAPKNSTHAAINRTVSILLGNFCHIAKRDNPKFDEEKFKLACGL